MRQKNIFYNLIKNETSLTEAFCNLLSYKPFRDMFLNIVNKKNNQIDSSKITFNDFETEILLEDDNGRPDLQLNSNNIEYFFEIKITKNSHLTDNQPKGYLQHLIKDKENDPNKRLFFIIPKGYSNFDKICKYWKYKTGYKKEYIKKYNTLFWEDIIDEIKSYELDKLNPSINDFRRIVESRWIKYIDILFTKQEIDLIFNSNKFRDGFEVTLDLNIPKIMQKLFRVVDEVYEKLEEKIDKKLDKQAWDCYGFWLLRNKSNIPDKWDIWFGVDFEIWGKRNFPLTVHIIPENEIEMKKILDMGISERFDYDDSKSVLTTFIGIGKEYFENPNLNLVKELEKKIYSTIEAVENYC